MPNPSARRCHGDDSDDRLPHIHAITKDHRAITRDQRIAMLENEVRELREANEILRNVAEHFALGGADQPGPPPR